ncbi:MAG: hypothetical protein R3D98_10230 [Candidatus Krumholzibacteriia bacterium]
MKIFDDEDGTAGRAVLPRGRPRVAGRGSRAPKAVMVTPIAQLAGSECVRPAAQAAPALGRALRIRQASANPMSASGTMLIGQAAKGPLGGCAAILPAAVELLPRAG